MEQNGLVFDVVFEKLSDDEIIEDHSGEWWKINYSNLKKHKTAELELLAEAPAVSQRFKGLVLHVLSIRKKVKRNA